jgi:hypothetical protein
MKVGSKVNDEGRILKINTLFPVSLEQLIQVHAAETGWKNSLRLGSSSTEKALRL